MSFQKYPGTLLPQKGSVEESRRVTLDLLDKINREASRLIELSAYVVPTGSIEMFGASTAPDGWLICDGSAVSRSENARLFSVIGTTWGAGDGVTTFNLPDFRESSPYGVGTRASGVTAHDAANLAQFKDDQLQNFQVGADQDLTGARDLWGQAQARDTTPSTAALANSSTIRVTTTAQGVATKLYPKNDGTNGAPRLGTVTRGKIIGVYFIIKT